MRKKPLLTARRISGPVILFLLPIVVCCWENVLGAEVPPFTATGKVATRSFDGSPTNVIFELQGDFVFQYSNGWWRVRTTYRSGFLPGTKRDEVQLAGTVLDCSRIEDGVRLFLTSEKHLESTNKTPVPMATAVPLSFPPPEHMVLLLPWLALCPSPELPILEKGLIRRFGVSQRMNDPRNRASYRAAYRGDESQFISELQITNPGVIFVRGGDVQPFSKPFDSGFLEFSYEVSAWTNFGKLPFPKVSVLHQYWPAHRAKTVQDVDLAARSSLEVLAISPMEPDTMETPAKLIASDIRLNGTSTNSPVSYTVINDRWQSATNAKLKRLSSLELKPQARGTFSKQTRRWVMLGLLLATMAAATYLIIEFRSTKTKKSNSRARIAGGRLG